MSPATTPLGRTARIAVLALAGLAGAAPIRHAAGQALAPDETDVVWRRWWSAYNRKDYDQACEISRQLLAMTPTNNVFAYNYGCVLALSGCRSDAMIWVKKSAELGFAEATLFETDTDLALIRDHPDYAAALEKVRQNRQALLKPAPGPPGGGNPAVRVPAGYEKTRPAPLVIALHGYGGTAEEMIEHWRGAADKAGAILAAPRAVSGAPDGGYAWCSVEEAESAVRQTLDFVGQRYNVDEERVVLGGFFQGGFMAYNVGLRRPQQFCGIIPVAGRYDPALASPPDAAAGRLPRFCILVGADDRVADGNRRAARSLTDAGAAVELRVFEGVGHGFPPERDAELTRALEFVLGAKE